VALSDAIQVVREMGLDWAVWRAMYSFCQRTGVLKRRFPPVSVDRLLSKELGVPSDKLDEYLTTEWRHRGGRFFLEKDISKYARFVGNADDVISRTDNLLKGRLVYFSRWEANIGFPPDWLLNPLDSQKYPGDEHWSVIPDLSERYGDIKCVWEASRFSQVFFLVRAYALTGDDKYPEAFWTLVESWIDNNLPELGPNWKCGQEIAIRSFAWLFGLYAFADCASSRVERIAKLIKYLWYNALHIERNHWYAVRCIRNNHSLSEAAGLYTIGTLFPFLPHTSRWRTMGRYNLVKEATWQVCSDGSYIMHSMNYARLVVQLFTWCFRIAEVNEDAFTANVRSSARKLMNFLTGLQLGYSGRVPNYGSNDGALLFLLSSCDYLDYRPALNALSVTLDGKALYERGPWSEEAAWFNGGNAVDCSLDSYSLDCSLTKKMGIIEPEGKLFPVGGYYVLRANDISVMIRCGKHIHRPGQADMLHVDAWYRGHNILVDSGTYSYNPRGGWGTYLASTAAHNTVTVDGRSQMNRLRRFMWAHWVHGRTLYFKRDGDAVVMIGEHHGYSPVIHRRLVALSNKGLLVIDKLFGDAMEHVFSLHWLLDDHSLTTFRHGTSIQVGNHYLQMRVGCSHSFEGTWVRADELERRGWQSLYYGERLPAWSYRANVTTGCGIWFATLLEHTSSPDSEPDALHWIDVESTLIEWGAAKVMSVFNNTD
jgi:hypothetical protein